MDAVSERQDPRLNGEERQTDKPQRNATDLAELAEADASLAR